MAKKASKAKDSEPIIYHLSDIGKDIVGYWGVPATSLNDAAEEAVKDEPKLRAAVAVLVYLCTLVESAIAAKEVPRKQRAPKRKRKPGPVAT